jgi:predicted RND superfamily exporter protein
VNGDAFRRVVRVTVRRPLIVLTLTVLLALGGAALALRLRPSTATETLVDRSSETFEATERFKRDFGDEAVLVLVKGELTRTVLTPDLGRVLGLEGCLGGNVRGKRLDEALALNRRDRDRGLPAVCKEIAELHPAKVVYGPGTFINTAADRIAGQFTARIRANAAEAERAARAARRLSERRGDPESEQDRLAKAARAAVQARFARDAILLGLRYGLTDVPRIDDPNFVSTLVFDRREPGVPKSRFAYLFPSSNAALIQVRMRPDLSQEQRLRAIELIREATGQRVFQPREGARYIVTGVPVVAEALADEVERSIFVLLGAALLVMAATLALVFRTRLRLLPLALALAAAALTFGALSLVGGSLTMASIAVLPVLIGLAVDYAIQFHARFDEERERLRGTAAEAATAAAAVGGPTILTAGIATAVGFLVLLLSPVPMVRGFGALLVLGIVLALLCAICAGFAALVRFGGRERTEGVPPPLPRLRAVGRHPRAQAANEWIADRLWRALGLALARPRRVLAVGLVVALAGLALDTQSEVVSDVRELVPQTCERFETSTSFSGRPASPARSTSRCAPTTSRVRRWSAG